MLADTTLEAMECLLRLRLKFTMLVLHENTLHLAEIPRGHVT